MNNINSKPSWECPYGLITGWSDTDNGVLRATGIKYAKSKRYEVPIAEFKTNGIIAATKWSPACPQPKDEFTEKIIGNLTRKMKFDEHCQYLSITVPPDATLSDKLPVMIWIHGGSYVTGAGDHPLYNPAALVREQHVIVVTITYRLGLFGYLGNKKDIPANLGLLDQIEALRWVKENITAFGGDSENITLFGESAGGDSVSHLMISQGTEGLFNRAIIQSAPFGILRNRSKMTSTMLDEVPKTSFDNSLEDVAAIQSSIQEKVKSFGLKSSMPFGVQYGHFPLPNEENLDKTWRKVASRIEVMVGNNERELAPFAPYIPILKKITSIPTFGKFATNTVANFLTHKVYSSGVKEFAKRHHLGGGRGYKYEINWGAPGNKFSGGHTIELPLLFEDKDLMEHAPILDGTTWAEFHRKGKALRQIWGGFARTGQVQDTYVEGLIKVKSI